MLCCTTKKASSLQLQLLHVLLAQKATLSINNGLIIKGRRRVRGNSALQEKCRSTLRQSSISRRDDIISSAEKYRPFQRARAEEC